MNKIFVSIIVIPFMAILLYKAIAISDYDLKQRYLKDQVDLIAYQVKITGTLTSDAYNEFLTKINKFADFGAASNCIVLKKGSYTNGEITGLTDYTIGESLKKGDAFLVYIKSSNISNYSRIENGGISLDDTQNLYYKAKAQCRVEVYNGE